MGVVIGAAVGGVVGALLLVGAVLLLVRKRKTGSEASPPLHSGHTLTAPPSNYGAVHLRSGSDDTNYVEMMSARNDQQQYAPLSASAQSSSGYTDISASGPATENEYGDLRLGNTVRSIH